MPSLRLRTFSSNVGQIYTTASIFGGTVSGETYTADNGDLEVTVVYESSRFETIMGELRDATRGDVVFDDGEDG